MNRNLKQISFLLVAVILFGMFGYSIIEGWSLFDSLYMTVITLATVGYGETHPLSTSGRIFTLMLIFGGMGIILYGITEVTAFMVQGEMQGFLRRRRMKNKIDQLSGHFVVCGAGRVGSHVMEEIIRTQRQCVVIEIDKDKVEKLAERDILVIDGDATDDCVLRSAGIERAAGMVVSLQDDKDNLFTVITARGLNQKIRIISKIEENRSREKFLRSGADGTVSTNFISGLRMASELMRPQTVNFLDSMLRDSSMLRIEDVAVEKNSTCDGEPIENCPTIGSSGVVLLSINKGQMMNFNPPPSTVVSAGDVLIVMGTPKQISMLRDSAITRN